MFDKYYISFKNISGESFCTIKKQRKLPHVHIDMCLLFAYGDSGEIRLGKVI